MVILAALAFRLITTRLSPNQVHAQVRTQWEFSALGSCLDGSNL